MSLPESDPSTAPSPPSLVDLTAHSAADLLLPWIASLISDHSPSTANREVVVYVHQPTRSLIITEGSSDAATFLSETIDSKEGPLPASKSSIDSLPRATLSSEQGFECAICLVEHEGGGDDVEVKEMPCRHKFHADCIDKWLGLRGTCPVCRFGMPVEEKKVDDGSGWRVHLSFSRGRGSESVSDSGSGEGRSGGSDDDMPAEEIVNDDQ